MLNLSYLDLIDCKSRIISFDKFPLHLCIWASKSLSDFAGTDHRIRQQGLWDSPLFRCCLGQAELGTTNILNCYSTNISTIREDLIDGFVYNIRKIDRNQDSMQMLLQHMLDEIYVPPPHLAQLSTCIIQYSHHALWNGIFPQVFLDSVRNDRLTAHRIVSKIIFKSLKSLYLL